jgi:hypothetical protein
MNFFDMIKSVDSFFFDYAVSTTFLSYLRIIVCCFVLIDFIILRKDILSHILPNGLFPYQHFLRINSEKLYNGYTLFSIKKLYKSETFSYFMFYSFYFFALASILGVFSNFSLLALFVIYTSIQSRAVPIWSTAGDQVITLLILCLAFTKCGEKISVDFLINNLQAQDYSNGWPIRFFQIYLSWIYFNAGIAKSKDPLWSSGEALRCALFNICWGKRYAHVVKIFNNKLTKYANYSIILIQFFAPLFLWLNNTRFVYVLILMCLHFGISLFLRLGYFGPLMIVALLTFFDYLFK